MHNIPVMHQLRTTQPLVEIDIEEDEVLQLLMNLKTDKSPGPDNVHPKVLRECAEEFVKPLHMLFKQSMIEGDLPQDWKVGQVTPIHKKGRVNAQG